MEPQPSDNKSSFESSNSLSDIMNPFSSSLASENFLPEIKPSGSISSNPEPFMWPSGNITSPLRMSGKLFISKESLTEDLRKYISPPPGFGKDPFREESKVSNIELIYAEDAKFEVLKKEAEFYKQKCTNLIKENKSLKDCNYAWFLMEKLEKITENNLKLSSELALKKESQSLWIDKESEVYDELRNKDEEIVKLQETIVKMEMEHQKQLSSVVSKYMDDIAQLESELKRNKECLEEALKNDRSKKINWRECPNCAEKQKEIVEKSCKIEELQNDVKTALNSEALKEEYTALKERITCKLAMLEKSLSEPNKVINLESKSLKTLVDDQMVLERWWVKVPEAVKDSDWFKEGQLAVHQIRSDITKALTVKPLVKGRPGREIRMSVHKKFIEIEQDFNSLPFSTEPLEVIKRKFLELPYMLRPLFDIMKDYEQQGIGIENSQNLKIEAALTGVKTMQEEIKVENFVFDQGRDMSAPKIKILEAEKVNEENPKNKRIVTLRRFRTDVDF